MTTATLSLELERTIRSIPGYDPYAQAGDCWFDGERAEYVIDFIETCCTFTQGEKAGQPFILERWQKAIVANLFGWMRPDGTRRYRKALLYLPRKNGKSESAAALICVMLFVDTEPGAQLYSAAAKRDQTRFVFDPTKYMVSHCPEMNAAATIYKKSIVVGDKGYLTISREATTEHGGNTHFAVLDELHAQPDRELVDVLDTSTLARTQPMIVYITTADYQRESICNEMHEYAGKVRDGIIDDPQFLPVIYEAKITDDWRDPKTWAKANPNLGVSISESAIAEQCQKAENSPAFENTFKRLHLNIQTEQETRWLDQAVWDACNAPPEFPKGCDCYGGFDLSSTSDFTAFAWVTRNKVPHLSHERFDEAATSFDGEVEDWYDVMVRLWVPEDRIAELEAEGYPQYRLWQKAGFIHAIPGAVIEPGFIRAEIGELAKVYKFVDIGYDKWSAWETATKLQDDHGLTMVEIIQGMKTLSEPTKKLERLLKAGKVRHGGHPVLSWMFSNVMVKSDENDNIRPVKPPHTVTGKMTPKIDGIVALIMAIHRAMKQEAIPASPYATRGVRTIGG